MFTFKRNQIIITVLVFMIAIAAYLNTKDGEVGVQPNLVQETDMSQEVIAEEKDFFEGYDEIQTLPPDAEEEISETMRTENNQQASAEVTQNTIPQMQKFEAVITKKDSIITSSDSPLNNAVAAVDKNMDVSYFVEEKMLREQSRALQVEELTQYVANQNLDKEAKSKAAENLLAIQERIEKESSAEALLRAKGFREVYVRIDDNSVDVVINKEDLTESDIAQIEEIVNRKTGYSVGKIKITPLKGIVKEGTN
ncbi:SpoIIIAH-like family protein [Cellulosilyticum sp. I15G10I2]|uniref:SpoIIIAH-like family protein n=1 Tax=Cellulosilyticum sp. I15G10I2 TaxID=1892843 RepID=UPI00085C928F|nr:SpoIIIAH-like family protein [Cellulosilyticum sp. I15G10I2]